MHPVRLCNNFFLPLLQKYNVACYIGSGAVLKGGIWKPDRPDQLRTFCKVFAYRRICLVKCTLACDESHNTTRSDLIQSLCKKVIMDAEVMLCISGIKKLIVPKRNIRIWYFSFSNWNVTSFSLARYFMKSCFSAPNLVNGRPTDKRTLLFLIPLRFSSFATDASVSR